jgi:hypothetical protein
MNFLGLAAILLAAAFSNPDPHKAVAGQYLEDRTMRVYACPCEVSLDWSQRGTEAVMAWNLQSGEHAGVSLAGLRVAAVIAGEFALTEATAKRRSVLFFGSAATPDQRRAGEEWVRVRYGEMLGRILGVHTVPIEFQFGPEAASLKIPGILDMRMRRARIPADTGDWAFLLYDPFVKLTSSTLGTTFRVHYSGPDLNMSWTREEETVTGYYGLFEDRQVPNKD